MNTDKKVPIYKAAPEQIITCTIGWDLNFVFCTAKNRNTLFGIHH
jgi:hypothetical protein